MCIVRGFQYIAGWCLGQNANIYSYNIYNPHIIQSKYKFKMVVRCGLYLCNINRLDTPDEVHCIGISKSTEKSTDVS